jgi:uncharacterized protein DUF4340
MNFKTTIVLLVLLAALGIYMLATRSSSTPSDIPVKPAEAKKLLDIKSEDVTKISITAADGKVTTLEKPGFDWQITSPIKGAADNGTVTQLLGDITGLTSQGQLDASKKSDNGLDHPSFTVELTTKDKTTKLLVGDKSLGKTLAVLVNANTQPDVVDASLYASLDKKPSAYRKTRLITAGTESIRQIEITRGKDILRLEKTGETWQITAPSKMPADSSSVENILFAITNLTAGSFDDDDTPADAGLTKPRIAVWFSSTAPSTQPTSSPATHPTGTTIKLGGYENVTEKNILASVDDGPIVIVPATTIDSFRKTALDLRDKTVVNIDPDRVESFSLTVAQTPTTQPSATQPVLALPFVPRSYAIERRKQDRALGPVLPTTNSTTAPSTQSLSTWATKSGAAVDDAQVKALLEAFHPLKVESFIAHPSSLPPLATSYTLSVHVGPGGGAAPQDYTLQITDPGGEAKLIGTSEGLTFNLDRPVAQILATEFKPTK